MVCFKSTNTQALDPVISAILLGNRQHLYGMRDQHMPDLLCGAATRRTHWETTVCCTTSIGNATAWARALVHATGRGKGGGVNTGRGLATWAWRPLCRSQWMLEYPYCHPNDDTDPSQSPQKVFEQNHFGKCQVPHRATPHRRVSDKFVHPPPPQKTVAHSHRGRGRGRGWSGGSQSETGQTSNLIRWGMRRQCHKKKLMGAFGAQACPRCNNSLPGDLQTLHPHKRL